MLLSVLWYCYKRGREVRLEGEASEKAAAAAAAATAAATEDIDDSARVEELPDDPQLPGPSSPGAPTPGLLSVEGTDNEHVKLFPPSYAAKPPLEAATTTSRVG